MPALCYVCNEAQHKYKCPKCMIKYCSLPCYKKHKDSQCEENASRCVAKSESALLSSGSSRRHNPPEDEVEDKVPEELLKKLGESNSIRDMLRNPHLARIVCHLDSSTNQEVDVEAAMHEPIFTEFVDECLRMVKPTLDSPPDAL